MQEPSQNQFPLLTAVWRLLETEQKHAIGTLGMCICLGLLGGGNALAQDTGTIRGTVTDGSTEEPLPGANVVLVGTQQGAATNAEGGYTIQGVDPGTYSVQASFLGYQQTVRENVQVNAGESTTVNFSLQQQQQALDELVVVGYGEQQRESVTAAVSKVDGADLAESSASDMSEALQGRVSGVTVAGDAPGEAPQIRIRGLTTPNSNDPLFVVDGVPVGNTLGVNTSNIESVEVLKDAASASIYGSRASGGVILVTTKRGSEGQNLQVDFDSYTGFQEVTNTVDLLNASQYVEEWSEIHQESGQEVPTVLQNLGSNPESYDYQDLTFRQGMIMSHNLGVSGGNETAKYRVSGGYLSREGTIVGSGYERYSLRVNTDFDLGRVRLGESLSLNHSLRQNITESQGRSIIEHTVKFAPYLQPYDESLNGGFNGPDQVDQNDAQNPLRLQMLGEDETTQTVITGNAFAEVDILESLMLRGVVGVDAVFSDDYDFRPSFETGSFFSETQSDLTETRTTIFDPVGTLTLNFNKEVGNHDLSFVGGGELDISQSRSTGASGTNDLSDALQQPGTVNDDIAIGDKFRSVLVSGFGRFNYNYDGRYLAQVSFRRDGNSRFGEGNKWGNFPAFSLGWNMAEEAFLEDLPVSMLKLRGSWGQVGNASAVGEYATQSTYNTDMFYVGGDGSQIVAGTITGLNNSALKWETTTMTNVGLDVGLLNGQLNFSGEYYENSTEDILLTVPVPGSFGYTGDPVFNTGTATTSGFEFSADYSGSTGEVDWTLSGNFGTSTNEVESLGRGSPITGADWQGSSITRVAQGEPIYHFYGYRMDRLYQESDFTDDGHLNPDLADPTPEDEGDPEETVVQPGDIKWHDVNGDDAITTADRAKIGNPLPDYTYGFTADLQWQGLDVSTTFQGAGGHQIYRAWAYWTEGMGRMFNAETTILDRWTPENTDTNVPRATLSDPANNRRADSDRWVEDGDYLRLKLVTLGYSIPTEFAPRIRNLRVYVQARNALTFTGYDGFDPEVGVWSDDPSDATSNYGVDYGQTPQARSFSIGVQLGF